VFGCCTHDSWENMQFNYMKYNNNTGYQGRQKILDLHQNSDGKVIIRSKANSSRFSYSRMKGCHFTGGRETVFLNISNLKLTDTGFYFCSYDQIFLESKWLIVMEIDPAVYQWIILASVLIFFIVVFAIAQLHIKFIEKRNLKMKFHENEDKKGNRKGEEYIHLRHCSY